MPQSNVIDLVKAEAKRQKHKNSDQQKSINLNEIKRKKNIFAVYSFIYFML